jgi:uncharacterized protein (TIGR03000 family)
MFTRQTLCLLLSVYGFTGAAIAGPPGADADLQKLLQERLDTARMGFEAAEKDLRGGNGSWQEVTKWSQRWLDAQLESSDDKAAARKDHFTRLKRVEEVLNVLVKEGKLPAREVMTAKYLRLEAEIETSKTKTTQSFYPPSEGRLAPLPVAPKTTATIVVRVPADARLTFDGVPTVQTGERRRFITGELEPGSLYRFDVRASWKENGQDILRAARTVYFRSGDVKDIDFTQPAAEPVPAAPTPKFP